MVGGGQGLEKIMDRERESEREESCADTGYNVENDNPCFYLTLGVFQKDKISLVLRIYTQF